MQIDFFCPMWGSAHLSVRDFMLKVKSAGYDGVEFGFLVGSPLEGDLIKYSKELSLQLVAQQWGAEGNTFSEYKADFQRHLEYLASLNPLFINSQTGKDYYSFDQNAELVELAKTISLKTGIQVIHETHRGKFPFCVATTVKFVDAFPQIGFTADFSHFCAVSESFLDDQIENLRKIIPHAEHIHARVGHTQGPQVSDPRLAEWEVAVNHHLQWWDEIIEIQRGRGRKQLTVTPEFGPAPYMFSLPGTGEPVVDQWEVNVYMMELLRKRYCI